MIGDTKAGDPCAKTTTRAAPPTLHLHQAIFTMHSEFRAGIFETQHDTSARKHGGERIRKNDWGFRFEMWDERGRATLWK